MASVPNSETFTLANVVDVVNPTTDDLQDCFNDSIDGYFDPMYKGSKNNLYNFRNYGWTADIGNEINSWNVNERWGFDEAPLLMDQVPGQPQFLMAGRNPWPDSDGSGFLPHTPYWKLGNTYLRYMAIADDGSFFDYLQTSTIEREYPTDLIILDNEYCVLATQEYDTETSTGNVRLLAYNIRLIRFSGGATPYVVTDSIEYSVNTTSYPNNVRLAYDGNNNLYVVNVTNVNGTSTDTNYVYHYGVGLDTTTFPFVRKFSTASPQITFAGVAGDIYAQNGYFFLSRTVSGNSSLDVFSITGVNPTGVLTHISSTYTFDLIEDMDGNKDDLIFPVSREDIYCCSWDGVTLTIEDTKTMPSPTLFLSVSYSELNNVVVTSNENVVRSYRIDGSNDFIQEDSLMVTHLGSDNYLRKTYCVRNNFHKGFLLTGMWDTAGGIGGYDPFGPQGDFEGAYLKTWEID